MNLVADGLPALALGLDPKDSHIMERSPYPPGEGVFARGLGKNILVIGTEIGLVSLIIYLLGLFLGEGDIATARTLVFTVLVVAQLFVIFECRSEDLSPFNLGYFSNPHLLLSVIMTFFLQLGVLYIPLFNALFRTVPLNSFQWGMIASGWRVIWKGIKFHFFQPVWRLVWQR